MWHNKFLKTRIQHNWKYGFYMYTRTVVMLCYVVTRSEYMFVVVDLLFNYCHLFFLQFKIFFHFLLYNSFIIRVLVVLWRNCEIGNFISTCIKIWKNGGQVFERCRVSILSDTVSVMGIAASDVSVQVLHRTWVYKKWLEAGALWCQLKINSNLLGHVCLAF